MGLKIATWVVDRLGSWPFMIGLACFMSFWFGWNSTPSVPHWDPNPYLLISTLMNAFGVFTAPLVFMAQKVSDARAQTLAELTEAEVRHVLELVGKYGHEDHEFILDQLPRTSLTRRT